MFGLPEGVEQLIQAFASGWQPTPSASAIQQSLRRRGNQVGIVDEDARVRCDCGTPVRCVREWHFYVDGAVSIIYHFPENYCASCYDSECECTDEREICEEKSAKSTWETQWEKSTGESYYDYKKDKLRAWVRRRML